MKIEYGPPGAVGVKQFQYRSDDDSADYISSGVHQIAKPLGAIALGTWAYAWITGREALRRRALGVSIAAFIVQLVTRP